MVLSIHWGPNWGYGIAEGELAFAHELVDRGAVDILFGHSSHHAKAIEIRRGRPILYGAGDLINDYEGIGGYDEFRPELAMLYSASFGEDGILSRLRAVPFSVGNFRLNRARDEQLAWLLNAMARECGRFGERVALDQGALRFDWHERRASPTR